MLNIKFLYFAVAAIVFQSTALGRDAGPDKDKDDKPTGPIIGIDLGTTYSCVAVYRNGRVDIIANDQGNRIIPSYVAFIEGEGRVVGERAKLHAIEGPEQTLFDVKRLIGRKFRDPTVQADAKLLPYKIVDKDGYISIEVKENGSVATFRPEQISAMILLEMRKIAEAHLGVTVTDAVITVPAYFNDEQRSATRDAGAIAGLNVRRIINEPTAAALAYGLDKQGGKEKTILVYDLGGGTFDVSLVTMEDGVFEVIATNGDTHLGGEDFDQNVMRDLIKIIKDKHKLDVSTNKIAVQKLRKAAEQAKRHLSVRTVANVEVESLVDDLDISIELTRSKFEELNIHKFRETLQPIREVLNEADITIDKIDEIVFVGGSTRIPKIRELVKEFFNGKEPISGINPDEAVAYGAAIQGSILSGTAQSELVLLDVCPLSLGIETYGNQMSKIITKNTTIPARREQTFTTYDDNQTTVQIRVFEGERPISHANNLLGQFDLTGIPPAPKGVPKITVAFEIDHNGQLHITASESVSKNTNKLVIEKSKRSLSQEQIEAMIRDAEVNAEADRAHKEKIDAMHDLEKYADSLEKLLAQPKSLEGKLDADDISKLRDALGIAKSKAATKGEMTADDYREAKMELESIAAPIMSKYYQAGGAPGAGGAAGQDFEVGDEL